MSADDYQRAADVKGIGGETLPAGRGLSSGEIAGLLTVCDNDSSPAGARDAAIIAVLYAAGLRRSELVGLDLADYHPDDGVLLVRHGKGHKEREMPIENGTAANVADWLALRGHAPGPLFLGINKAGHIQPGRLASQAVYKMLRKRGLEAGVSDFSPHDMRRTFVSDLLDAGADLAIVQRLAGHANIQTTGRHDRRPEAAKRKAIQLLHVPHHRRTLDKAQ